MEIFFSILCAIFAVIASIFSVRNRVHGSKSRTGSSLRDDWSRYNDIVSNSERLERDKDRIQELDRRDDDNIAECARISGRIRKREPETSSAE